METTLVYWGNIGIMEKKMETTIMGLYRGILFKRVFSKRSACTCMLGGHIRVPDPV